MRTYKAIDIKYDTDEQQIPGLPTMLAVRAKNKEGVADAISDKTGWCVESIGSIQTVPDYKSLRNELYAFEKKAKDALLALLESRDVSSINVAAYVEHKVTDECRFPQTDKNGYGVNVAVKTIRKNDDGDWVTDTVDEDYSDWYTTRIDNFDYPGENLVWLLGMIEAIFKYADKHQGGKVLAAGEDFEN